LLPPRSTLFPYTTLFRSTRFVHGQPQTPGCCVLVVLDGSVGRYTPLVLRRIAHIANRIGTRDNSADDDTIFNPLHTRPIRLSRHFPPPGKPPLPASSSANTPPGDHVIVRAARQYAARRTPAASLNHDQPVALP